MILFVHDSFFNGSIKFDKASRIAVVTKPGNPNFRSWSVHRRLIMKHNRTERDRKASVKRCSLSEIRRIHKKLIKHVQIHFGRDGEVSIITGQTHEADATKTGLNEATPRVILPRRQQQWKLRATESGREYLPLDHQVFVRTFISDLTYKTQQYMPSESNIQEMTHTVDPLAYNNLECGSHSVL